MVIQEEIKIVRFIEYDGIKFYADKKGYWLSSRIKELGVPKRLHIYVWEKYNGKILDGYHVHHIDKNKDNNDINNLKLMSGTEHLKYHMSLRNKNELKINITKYAMPAAKEWHKSKKGSEWHKEHYEEMKDKLHTRLDIICLNCGKEVNVGYGGNGNKFCSSKCKDKYKATMGTYDEERTCVVCNNKFMTNKYNKKTKTCSKSCAGKLRYMK